MAFITQIINYYFIARTYKIYLMMSSATKFFIFILILIIITLTVSGTWFDKTTFHIFV